MKKPKGVIINLPTDLSFGRQTRRVSPYATFLNQLKEAGPGKALKIENGATYTLKLQAKKLGLNILSAKDDAGAIYVRLVGAELSPALTSPKVDLPQLPASLEQAILRAVRTNPMSAITMASWLKSNANMSVMLSQLDTKLLAMSHAGTVSLGKDLKWRPA